MIGRVLRPAEGKPDAIILDHSGAVFRHGFVEDRVHWTLDPDRRAESPTHQQRCAEYSSRLIECTNCGAIRTAGEACFHCGFLPQRAPRAVVIADGDLALVNGAKQTDGNSYPPSERARWHAMLIYIGDERGYKTGWACAQVQRKIRRVSRVGGFAQSNGANGRSQIVGALAHDRLRKKAGRMKRKHKIDGQFAPRTIAMLRSPAMRALSLSGRRILDRIEIELASHGGKDNGKLPITFANFEQFGITDRHVISRGIRELCALGFVERARGRSGNAEHRAPNFYSGSPIYPQGGGRRPTIGSESKRSNRPKRSRGAQGVRSKGENFPVVKNHTA